MVALALMVLALQQAAPFDTTIEVRSPPDTRLEVRGAAGSIDVKIWDRAAVRIVAKPSRGAAVWATLDGAVLTVAARSPGGRIDLVDYEITVPRAMDLKLGWGDVDITVHGAEGAVEARNSTGRITIDGGRGTIAAESINGPIVIRRARGRVSAKSGNAEVRVEDSSGDLDAQSTTSHVTLTGIETRNLRAASVGGVVRFSGPLFPDGRYDLSSHSGSIWMKTPAPIDATVSVATVNGAFTTGLPHEIVERRRRGIFTARFGNGRAQVSVESFNGAIVLEQM